MSCVRGEIFYKNPFRVEIARILQIRHNILKVIHPTDAPRYNTEFSLALVQCHRQKMNTSLSIRR